MVRRLQGTSPSESSDGDGARALYDELTDDLLYDPAIGRATMMGYPCVRLAGRFLAAYDNKAGALVVKLPRERVTELVECGDGDPFAPAGKVFREWVSISLVDRKLWRTLLGEAADFARQDGQTTSSRNRSIAAPTSPWARPDSRRDPGTNMT
jgi:hypothetical protein